MLFYEILLNRTLELTKNFSFENFTEYIEKNENLNDFIEILKIFGISDRFFIVRLLKNKKLLKKYGIKLYEIYKKYYDDFIKKQSLNTSMICLSNDL